MANQPPRPWFRLPNLARQPTSAPAPAPTPASEPQAAPPQQPRLPVIHPAFRPAFTQSRPSSPPPPPPPQPQPAPPTAMPSPPPTTRTPLPISSPSPSPSPSPPPPAVTPSRLSPSPSPTPTPPYVASPPPSTRMSRLPTPIPSPKSPIKTYSPPPITLPPPQSNSSNQGEPRTLPEPEQEKALLQETFNKKAASSHGQSSSVKGFLHKAVNKHHKKPSSSSSDNEDSNKNVKIITMTGDNKGALMELGLPSKTNNEGKTHFFPGTGHVLGNADSSKTDKDHQGNESSTRLPMSGYVNSNVQGVNNSILCNCSFTHHDPGVHFSVSRKKPINGGITHGNSVTNGKKL